MTKSGNWKVLKRLPPKWSHILSTKQQKSSENLLIISAYTFFIKIGKKMRCFTTVRE